MRAGRISESVRSRPERTRHGERAGERLVGVFCLAATLFSPLILELFDRGVQTLIFGVPLLYFYMFAAWALIIVLLACAVERSTQNRADGADEHTSGGTP